MTHQVDEDVRRDTPRRGPAVVMALGIIGALVLAVMFPFAVSTVQPKQLPPLERAIQQLDQGILVMGGDANAPLDPDSLRLLEVDEHEIGYFAGYAVDGTPVGMILHPGRNETATVGYGEPGSSVVGFASGSATMTAFLGVQTAPSAELGFRYCAASSAESGDFGDWMNDTIANCGFLE